VLPVRVSKRQRVVRWHDDEVDASDDDDEQDDANRRRRPPYVERMLHMPRLSGALSAITAAVVGVILNLSLWFSAHVMFRQIDTITTGPFTLIQPDFSSIDLLAAAIAGIAAILLLVLKLGIGRTLLAGAALGMISLLPNL
ncbi:MAG: hypothetical protein AAF317_11955, partial [Pseudomonadota bacterium]